MLLTLLLLACPRPHPPEPVMGFDPLVLGWRLVPGETLQYTLSSRLEEGGAESARLEQWSYVVREVDDRGVATLEGRLIGLGAEFHAGGERVDDHDTKAAREAEKERLSKHVVELRLGMDGRLASLEGLDWPDSLPHRLLGLGLSEEPVDAGERWPDPSMSRPYALLMPVDLEITVEGFQTLEGLYDVDGELQAHLSSSGRVRPEDPMAPGLRLAGEAWWDVRAGRLVSRELELELVGPEGDSEGRLVLGIERLD